MLNTACAVAVALAETAAAVVELAVGERLSRTRSWVKVTVEDVGGEDDLTKLMPRPAAALQSSANVARILSDVGCVTTTRLR